MSGSTRILMTGSAAAFAVVGVALLFLPQEVGRWVGMSGPSALPLQLASGGFVSMAVLNWVGRRAIYGGIYGRPIVVANFGFGMVMGGSVVDALLANDVGVGLWFVALPLALHALAFGRLMFAPPWPPEPGEE